MKDLFRKAYDAYARVVTADGVEPRKYHFIMGYASAIGVLGGTIDCNIPQDTDPFEVYKVMREELGALTVEVDRLLQEEKSRAFGRLN